MDEETTTTTDTYDIDVSPEVGLSARPALRTRDASGPLGVGMVDEGSDVDEDEMEEDEVDLDQPEGEVRRRTLPPPSSADAEVVFGIVPIEPVKAGQSSLTAALNKHIPHLVSTSHASQPSPAGHNPFSTLYSFVGAAPGSQAISLEIYFPHSQQPTEPIRMQVRKDASVEEVTGFGLLKYWDAGRTPRLDQEESEQKWSTIAWGLRIVEDDGEVDEDFPRACPR